MANAYIKLVPGSTKQEITLDDVKELFYYYKEITSKTGQQVSWEYGDAAFPYDIKENNEEGTNWFYLKSTDSRYNLIVLGVGKEEIEDEENKTEQYYIQITLPQASTHGDKGKANEFCKFLGKKLQGELHLFNGRIMYYYPRK
ncbi:DUF1885 family protein [Bacillus luteolus]|uniref:DUF1885 family protein n=1 Tax=Litchfieldia luteola TaxID=682179 RepID=A0ABR9QK55_9BACI|nr:DUF1885 family protein [Cytobacillus luteolus]MBE4908890.1 DUF1885 family protein [Cytobacillus luteolus]MBP1941748.1 hypothetical protein [Cytobacillus luteolus]